MYPDARVADFIDTHFVPVKVHIKEQPKTFERFAAQWTPTLLILDPQGVERYRFEGYLPADEFLAQLAFGLAKMAFALNRFDEAEKRFREVAEQHPDSELAPEAIYWAGVSRYKGTNDHHALPQTAQRLEERYPDSSWTKRASVWKVNAAA